MAFMGEQNRAPGEQASLAGGPQREARPKAATAKSRPTSAGLVGRRG
jgi:hypothetical protein